MPSRHEVELIRSANQAVKAALDAVAAEVAPGVTTGRLDSVAEEVLTAHGAGSLFVGQSMQNVASLFRFATCVSVNEEVIHGVPGDRVLLEGDIVTVDCGAILDEWCGDSARTWPVGKIDSPSRKLLDVTRAALDMAIAAIRPGERWSHIARRIQNQAERNGFGVVRDYCGHGVGRSLHLPPQVPNYVDTVRKKKEKDADFILEPGMVIAVEPMFTAGTYRVCQSVPGEWPIVTKDGSRSAHFEHTVAVVEDGADVLSA